MCRIQKYGFAFPSAQIPTVVAMKVPLSTRNSCWPFTECQALCSGVHTPLPLPGSSQKLCELGLILLSIL